MGLLALVALSGCAPDLTPSWAYDPIWLEPAGEGGAFGFQTWELFGPRWDEKRDDRHYVCAVVVAVQGVAIPCDAQEGCEHAWEVTPAILETDCAPPTADDPLFTSLQRLALGSEATGEVPHPGQTSTGWADYGGGWEVHGYAYPEALDHELPAGSFDEGEPYLLLPTKAFPYPP